MPVIVCWLLHVYYMCTTWVLHGYYMGTTWVLHGVTLFMTQVYSGDLEAEFRQFQDWLKVFPLLKGKVDDDDDEGEEERLMGKYKVGRSVDGGWYDGMFQNSEWYVLEQKG